MVRCLLFLLYLVSSFTLVAQRSRITVDFKNAPLGEVIKQIEQLCNKKFSYSSSSIPLDQRISISLEQASVTEVLDKIRQETSLSYKVINGVIVLTYIELTQTIRGKVLDQANQMPIVGATVTIIDTNPIVGDATDVNGQFKIINVPIGRRSIKVTSIGYEERIIPNILIGSGKEAIIDVDLIESITQMDEVVVVDEGVASLPVNEMAQVSARSFTVEETKRFPVGIGDPLRLASSFAGVVSSDDVNNEIVIRGNTPRGILWKLDGIEIPSPNHFSSEGTSSGGISMFSTQVISRSDFFTGAFAPEYGNATAGVFDIHLRKGNNEKSEKTIQAGLLGLDVSAEGPFQEGTKSSYLFNYRYSTLAMLDGLGLDLLDEDEKTSFQDLSFKLNFPTRVLGTFSVFGLGGLSKVTRDFYPEISDEGYDMGVVGVSNQFSIDRKTFIRTTLSASGTEVIDDYTQLGDLKIKEIHHFSKTYQRAFIQLNRKFNAKHLLESGFTLSKLDYIFKATNHNEFNLPPYDDYTQFDESGGTGSKQLYLSWKYRMNEKLSLVNGLHWLHFDLTGESSWEPRSSLHWQFAPDKSFSLGYGMHSRIESLEYYFGNYIADNGAILNYNRDLGLTKANHFVVGYEKAFNEKASFKTEVYYQYLFNVPVFLDSMQNAFSTLNLSDGYTPQRLINAGTGTNYGIEFTFERKFADSYFYLMNLSIYESKYRARDGVRRDTRFNGNAASNFLFGKEFKVGRNGRNNILGFNAKLSWAGNKRYTPISLKASQQFNQEVRPLINTYKLKYPDHTRFDLQISFRRNTAKTTSEWRLDLQNVFNRENVLYDYYNAQFKDIESEKSVGFIPILSYRLEF